MSKKNYSALILKISSLVIICLTVIFSVLSAIWLIKYPLNASYVWILYPIIALIYIVFFYEVVALYYLYKLMHEIEISKQVTHKTLYYLRRVKLQIGRSMFVFVAMMPFVYALAKQDDSPGLLLIHLAIIVSSGLFYLLMNVFYRLFHDAITAHKE